MVDDSILALRRQLATEIVHISNQTNIYGASRVLGIDMPRLSDLRHELRNLSQRLQLLGPDQVLARGYSITMDAATGRVLRQASDVRRGQRLRTRLSAGEIISTAES